MQSVAIPAGHGCVGVGTRRALAIPRASASATSRASSARVPGRGLHLSTFRLNVSAFCGIGGCVEGLFRGCQGDPGGVWGCLGCADEA